MVPRSTSKSWTVSNRKDTSEIGARSSRSTSTVATATEQIRMSAVTQLVFLLVIGVWLREVSAAPTPAQDAVAGHGDDGSLFEMSTLTDAGKDVGNQSPSTHFGHAGWRKVEIEKPPDLRSRNGRQYLTDSKEDLVWTSSLEDDVIADTARNLTGSPPSRGAPSVSQEDEANVVFNIVIQTERTDRAAYIAPDVDWLRDLVPKVVDVADQPELLIKETIVNAIDDERAIDVELMRRRPLIINVVKSDIGSDVEVPEVLARLRNLMRTGGPTVENIRLESRDVGGRQMFIYVINVIIFNFVVLEAAVEKPIFITDKVSNVEHDISEDSYLVALRDSQQNRLAPSSTGPNEMSTPQKVENNRPRTPDSAILEEDSYVLALRESQKNRKETAVPVVVAEATSDRLHYNGHYLTEVPAYADASTARPLTAMEQYYLRRFSLTPTQQPIDTTNRPEQTSNDEPQPADEQTPVTSVQHSWPALVTEPDASQEFVTLPTGPYFTRPTVNPEHIVHAEPSSTETPIEIEAVIVDSADQVGSNSHRIEATTRKPAAKKPLMVRLPEAVGLMTNKATNMVRDRIRTVGMGLASTVNSWLPSVTALGRRRKRRSVSEENLPEHHRNPNVNRAVDVAQAVARLMGKRYTDAAEGSSAKTAIGRIGSHDRDHTLPSVGHSSKLAKVSPPRPVWFPFRRAASTWPTWAKTRRRPSARRSAFARKMKEIQSNTRKYVTPLFYTPFFANDAEMMERTESIVDEALSKDGADDITEPAPISDESLGQREDLAVNEEKLENLNEQSELVPHVTEHREAAEISKESTEPSVDSALGPPAEDDVYLAEEPETQVDDETDESAAEETSQRVPAFNSPSGFDFDIVSNFVRAMMTNKRENNGGAPEAREEVFWIKEATIVNTTETGNHKPHRVGGSSMLLLKPGSTRLPSSVISGNKVKVFPADPLRPSSVSSENATSSPLLTYTSIKSPTKVTWLGIGPPDAMTSSTQSSSSSAESDPTGEINDGSPLDLPPSEIVGAPLQFYDEETDNYVSKEVPGVPGSPTISYYTDRAPSTDRIPSHDLPAEPSSAAMTQNASDPVRPLWPSTDLRPGLSHLLLTIASFNRPRLPASVAVSSSNPSIQYTIGQGFATVPQEDEYNSHPTDKYTHGHGIASQPDDVSKYTHGHGTIVTDEDEYEAHLSAGASSLVSNLVKGTDDHSPNGQSTSATLVGETSVQFVGVYGGTSVDSTAGPFTASDISDSEELHSTLNDLIAQLKANLTTGLVTTDRPIGGIHFTNTSTDIVLLNPFVTPSSVFPPSQVEAVEAETGDPFASVGNAGQAAISPGDAIVVDALDGDEPDSVPDVSSLANLFFTASASGSSSSAGSSAGSFPSGVGTAGVTSDSVSSSSTNPLALLYTFGLAAVGVLLVTLPIWIPFVVTRIKRRTYPPSKTYAASKKKPTHGYSSSPPRKTYAEPPANHYKDMDDEEMYGNDHYLDQHHLVGSGPSQPQYASTTIDDLYRPTVGQVLGSSQDLLEADEHYIFRDSIALNPLDDMFSHAGPLSSEAIYGSPARIYLKARRRRSNRFRPSNKR